MSVRLQKGTHIDGVNFNPPDQASSLPVEKSNSTLALDTQEHATSKTLGLEANIKPASLLHKVLVDLDARRRLADRVVIAIVLRPPHKVLRRAERLVAPRQSGVDNILAVAADGDEAAIGRVNQRLWIDLARA